MVLHVFFLVEEGGKGNLVASLKLKGLTGIHHQEPAVSFDSTQEHSPLTNSRFFLDSGMARL